MNFEEICKLDPMVLALYQEATAFRVISETGQRIRIWDAERAAKLKPDPEFCRTQLFKAIPLARGEVGLKHFLKQRVGYCAQVSELRNSQAYEQCLFKFLQDMPHCNHAPDKLVACEDGGVVAESICSYSYPVPPGKCDRFSGKKGRISSLIERLRNHDGRQLHESVNLDYLLSHPESPEPEPIDLTPIDDLSEPVFLVNSEVEAKQLAINIQLRERWQHKTISTWYARNAIFIADSHTCGEINRAKNLRREDFLGGLAWKPIVLTFSNPRFSARLSSIGLAITEVDGLPESIESFRKAVAVLEPQKALQLPDLPEEALDGWLGKVCRERMADFPRAYAWPALLAVAGALVDESPIRTNLYVGLIGDPGTGKTTAINKALWLLDMKPPILFSEKVGSGEGLAERIGNQGDNARLWCPDELGHTMAKAQIQNSTFPETLTSAWSTNQNNATIARQKLVEFSCRLSIAGGLVTDRFGDAFGSSATGGLWDRFIFGECPSGFSYFYRPNSGEPARTEEPSFDDETRLKIVLSEIDSAVWDERDRWVKEENINRRVCENAIRCAAIAAAFDGRSTLHASDLGPALVFARYQEQMRGLHKPNPGRNDSGVIYHKISDYLERFSPDEEWLEQRKVIKNTHAYDYGMPAVERTLESMEKDGQIERKKQGRKPMIRKRI